MSGFDSLKSLLAPPDVTDVVVNGSRVWIDRGDGMERAAVSLGNERDVRALAQRIAARCGRRLDDAQPWVDARLDDGTRFHAILPPLATDGVCMSFRTFRRHAFSVAQLLKGGTLTPISAVLVRSIVNARLSYIVTGGAGLGKTTILASLLSCVHGRERIVVVEDVTELRCTHPHVVSLQTRGANSEGAGEVSLRQLVRQALRMRPDRLVIGECRGSEVVELLGALNTGHDGSAGTLHANSPHDVPARLEALASRGGMVHSAVMAGIAAGLHCVLHMRRGASGRVLSEIGVVAPKGGEVFIEPAWRFDTASGSCLPGAELLRYHLGTRGCEVPEW